MITLNGLEETAEALHGYLETLSKWRLIERHRIRATLDAVIAMIHCVIEKAGRNCACDKCAAVNN